MILRQVLASKRTFDELHNDLFELIVELATVSQLEDPSDPESEKEVQYLTKNAIEIDYKKEQIELYFQIGMVTIFFNEEERPLYTPNKNLGSTYYEDLEVVTRIVKDIEVIIHG